MGVARGRQPLGIRFVAAIASAAAVLASGVGAASAHPGHLQAVPIDPAFARQYHPGTSNAAPRHADRPADLDVHLVQQVRANAFGAMTAPQVATQVLPTRWCGTERRTDNTTDATLTNNEPHYKLVYAFASDQPDRFALWKNVLQADVSLTGQYMGQQSGGTKTPR